tara:strand:+ start:2799 stop:3293 length:495 start_codon:yes stop_codon:yes gene_type:complete
MTSLIGAGQGARRRAQQGFGAVSKLESQEIRQMDMLDAARKQQEMSNLGTGAGFGAMYGLSKVPTAAATTTTTTSAPLATLASTSPEGGISVLKGLETAAGMAPNTLGATTATVGASTGGGAAAGTGTAAAAGGSATTAGTLATLATPIAIGLGAAFLINKLFD